MDSTTLTTFLECCERGHVHVALAMGKEHRELLHQANSDGFTGLILAAKEGYIDIVQGLLDMGCNPNPTSAVTTHSALRGAAIYGRTEVVKLLLDRGADCNVRSKGQRTALMGAARGKHVETTRILLQYGANPSLINDDGETALDLARQVDAPIELIRMLMDSYNNN